VPARLQHGIRLGHLPKHERVNNGTTDKLGNERRVCQSKSTQYTATGPQMHLQQYSIVVCKYTISNHVTNIVTT
jgi:hypothetical protein